MEPNLNDESITNILMTLRQIETLKSCPDLLEENEDFKSQYLLLSSTVNQLMNCLTVEQKVKVLEEHKRFMEEIKREHKK